MVDDVGGWSLDVELLDRIAATLSLYESPHVMEMGSGAGTQVLAKLVKNRGGRLATLEHDPDWHRQTSSALKRAGLSRTATVYLCPLVAVDTFGVHGRFYDMARLMDRDPYDVVIVDGPPTATNPLARVPALPAVSDLLNASSFHVFLDDFERTDEKKAVEIWQTVAPDLKYDTLTFAKEVAVVRSPSASPVPAPGEASPQRRKPDR